MLTLMLAIALNPPQGARIVVALGESLHVEVRGTGPAVVLIPGLFGSSYGYRGVVARLTAQGKRTIVIEPLGLGRSSRPRGADYSLTAQADRIAAALDTLRVTDAVVVAHAVGAGMALRLALRRPGLVRSVVSLEGGAAEAAATPGFRRAMSMAPLIRLVGGAGLVRSKVRSSLIQSSGDASWVTDEVIAEYTGHATANVGPTLHAFKAMAASREAVSLRDRLGEVRCPVLLMVGGAQHAGGVDEIELGHLRRGVRAFSVEVVPGAGSYLHEEQPALVAAAVGRMLAERTATTYWPSVASPPIVVDAILAHR